MAFTLRVFLKADDLPTPCRAVLYEFESVTSLIDQQDLLDPLVDDELIANEIVFNLRQVVSALPPGP